VPASPGLSSWHHSELCAAAVGRSCRIDARRRVWVPQGFYWGTATSAYQIEGSWNKDGKGPSIWDMYAYTRGKVRDGTTGEVVNDYYHRYK
jgi:hypothetical protein